MIIRIHFKHSQIVKILNYSNHDPGLKLGPQNVVEKFRKRFRNLRLKNNKDAICAITIKDRAVVMVICNGKYAKSNSNFDVIES